MATTDLTQKIAHLNTLLEEKLRLRKGSLGHRAHKAARLVPRWVRRNLLILDRAQSMAGHPKLARQLDQSELDRAYRTSVKHLETIDPKERRKDFWLGMMGGLAFNLALFAGLLWLALWYFRPMG